MLTPKKLETITLSCIGLVAGMIVFICGAYLFNWFIYTPGLLLMGVCVFFLSRIKS